MPEKDWNCYQEFTPAHDGTIRGRVFGHGHLHLTRPEVDRLSGRWDQPRAAGRSTLGAARHRLPAALLEPGDTAVDIGANLGCHTVEMSACVGGTGRVLAFEPQPLIFRRLARNIAQNGCTNVTALPFAVDAEHRPIALTKVNWIQAEKNLGDIYITGIGTGGQAVPLDAFCLSNIRLIKLDVQGCEVRSFKGNRTNARSLPSLSDRRGRGILLAAIWGQACPSFWTSSADLATRFSSWNTTTRPITSVCRGNCSRSLSGVSAIASPNILCPIRSTTTWPGGSAERSPSRRPDQVLPRET